MSVKLDFFVALRDALGDTSTAAMLLFACDSRRVHMRQTSQPRPFERTIRCAVAYFLPASMMRVFAYETSTLRQKRSSERLGTKCCVRDAGAGLLD